MVKIYSQWEIMKIQSEKWKTNCNLDMGKKGSEYYQRMVLRQQHVHRYRKMGPCFTVFNRLIFPLHKCRHLFHVNIHHFNKWQSHIFSMDIPVYFNLPQLFPISYFESSQALWWTPGWDSLGNQPFQEQEGASVFRSGSPPHQAPA